MSAGLPRIGLLADLPDPDFQLLDRVMVAESHPDGHVFVREGERATHVTGSMFVVLEGTVEVAAAKPEGGFAGLGTSPVRMMCLRVASTAGFGIGTADSSALV